jgi:2-amino-4-hydroxy-6-hydroxymethyldihydropteridine diphosphokinase
LNDLVANKKQIVISIGSNIDPEHNIPRAIQLLSNHLFIIKESSIWQTPAVGSQGPDFLNAAILAETARAPDEIKEKILKKIENDLGRIRTENKSADRTIDLDLILYDGVCRDHDLWTQAHIAVPVSDLIPDVINPKTGKTMFQTASELLPDSGFILRTNLD